MSYQPQQPTFAPIKRFFLTEEELDKPVAVVEIAVWGKYTKRGSDRKEVLEADFDAKVEVPADFNVGHIKLSCNRHVKNVLRGIRVRTYQQDKEVPPKPLQHRRRVRDFMSDKGLRDNKRMKRNYEQELEKRKADIAQMEQGILPPVTDSTMYGNDGLPPLSDNKNYITD